MSSHRDRDAAEFDAHGNTRPAGTNYITNDRSDDGIDRRGFCGVWHGPARASFGRSTADCRFRFR